MDCIWIKNMIWLSVYDFCTSKRDDCIWKKKKKIMQKLEDGDKESMLMYMLIKTTIDSIIQINAYRKSISLNVLNLPNDKLASLANLENSAEAMREVAP